MSSEENQVGADESSPAPDGSALVEALRDTARKETRILHRKGNLEGGEEVSDTPRTDSLLASKTKPITAVKEFMRTLERELNIEKSEKLKYRVRAWKAESQLDMRYGLRKEINEALGLTNETGDDALRKGLETIKALKAERDALLEAAAGTRAARVVCDAKACCDIDLAAIAETTCAMSRE